MMSKESVFILSLTLFIIFYCRICFHQGRVCWTVNKAFTSFGSHSWQVCHTWNLDGNLLWM